MLKYFVQDCRCKHSGLGRTLNPLVPDVTKRSHILKQKAESRRFFLSMCNLLVDIKDQSVKGPFSGQECFLFHPKELFLFHKCLHFGSDFFDHVEKRLDEKTRVIF